MAVAAAVGSTGRRSTGGSGARRAANEALVDPPMPACWSSATRAPACRFPPDLQFPRSAREWQILRDDCQSADAMRLPRLLPWAVRAAWATLPFTVGAALAAALDERSSAVRTTASAGLWAAWVVVLVATLVPHPISLTALRVSMPAVVVATALAAAAGEATAWSIGAA